MGGRSSFVRSSGWPGAAGTTCGTFGHECLRWVTGVLSDISLPKLTSNSAGGGGKSGLSRPVVPQFGECAPSVRSHVQHVPGYMSDGGGGGNISGSTMIPSSTSLAVGVERSLEWLDWAWNKP